MMHSSWPHYALNARKKRLKKKVKKAARKNGDQRPRHCPAKLADCTDSDAERGEIVFWWRGDSAGGSAKQARDRQYQAIFTATW